MNGAGENLGYWAAEGQDAMCLGDIFHFEEDENTEKDPQRRNWKVAV